VGGGTRRFSKKINPCSTGKYLWLLGEGGDREENIILEEGRTVAEHNARAFTWEGKKVEPQAVLQCWE
jgi:hypothetical protein